MPTKKPTKSKLKLNKEVVRQLMDAELKRVAGGTVAVAELCGSKDAACTVSQGCTEPLTTCAADSCRDSCVFCTLRGC